MAAKGKKSDTDRLRELAGQLDPPATKAPWHVRGDRAFALRRTFPTAGWYWIPPGHKLPVFLAANSREAFYELQTLIEHQEHEP